MPFHSEQLPRRYLPGEPAANLRQAERLNAPIEQLAQLKKYIGRNLTEPDTQWVITEHFLGKIVSTPNTFTDARYNVQREMPDPDIEPDDTDSNDAAAAPKLTTTEDQFLEPQNWIVTATNLVEAIYDTHFVDVGEMVHVFGVNSISSAKTAKFYYFVHGAATGVAVVEVTGHSSYGGGKYAGLIAHPPSTAVSTGDLVMPEGMTLGDNCLILNLPEDGTSTHSIANNTYHNGIIVGRFGSEATPTWIVTIGGGSGGGGCFPEVEDVYDGGDGLYQTVASDSGCTTADEKIIDFTDCDSIIDGGVFGSATTSNPNIYEMVQTRGDGTLPTPDFGQIVFADDNKDLHIGDSSNAPIKFDRALVPTAVKTANYTAAISEFVRVDPSGGGFTVTLPTAVGQTGKPIVVKNTTTSTTAVTIATTSSQTIDGASTQTLNLPRGWIWVISDGSNWQIIDTKSGGGSPGGSDTQVQFNDSGAFGGDGGFTYNKSTNTVSADRYLALDGTNAAPSVSFTNYTDAGMWINGGSLQLSPASSSNIVLISSYTGTSIQLHLAPQAVGGDSVLKFETIVTGPTTYSYRMVAENSTTYWQLKDNGSANRMSITPSSGVIFPNMTSSAPLHFMDAGTPGTDEVQAYYSGGGYPGLVIKPKHTQGTLQYTNVKYDLNGILGYTDDAAPYSGTGLWRMFPADPIGYTTTESANDTGCRWVANNHDQSATFGFLQADSTGWKFSGWTNTTLTVKLLAAATATVQSREILEYDGSWPTSTDASRKARAIEYINDAGARREVRRVESNGSAAMQGFFGAAAVVQQTGASAGGIAAITDANAQAAIGALQTALANLGFVTSPP